MQQHQAANAAATDDAGAIATAFDYDGYDDAALVVDDYDDAADAADAAVLKLHWIALLSAA